MSTSNIDIKIKHSLNAKISVCAILDDSVSSSCLINLENIVSQLASDTEIILISNGTPSEKVRIFVRTLNKMSNTTLHFLNKRVDTNFAKLIAIDNSIGDWILLIDINNLDVNHWRELIKLAKEGYEVVSAKGQKLSSRTKYFWVRKAFLTIYNRISGLKTLEVPPPTRFLSRSAALFLLNQRNGEMILNCQSFGPCFPSYCIEDYNVGVKSKGRSFKNGIQRAYKVLSKTNGFPVRTLIIISLVSAFLNVLYSLYTVYSFFMFENIAPGWITQSFQMSGMFFLFSLLFALLGEHLISIENSVNHRLRYTIIREIRSQKSRRYGDRNIVEPSNSGDLKYKNLNTELEE